MVDVRSIGSAGVLVLALLTAEGALGISPDDRCEADKHRLAGNYALCRHKAESTAIRRGLGVDYSKCDLKLTTGWAKAELKALNSGGTCSDAVTDAAFRTFVSAHTDAVVAALDGNALPECGDGMINVPGEQCDGDDLGGQTCAGLGLAGGTLVCAAACTLDASTCVVGGGLVPGADPILPATGQLMGYGSGSDGAVRAGRPLSYVDNEDGTISDLNTGLMWEKKNDFGGVHDVNNTYSWSSGSGDMDGEVVSDFLNILNDIAGGGANCFAGYCDWRIPNYKELTSILDLERFDPAIDPVFHRSATCAGCSDITQWSCSCTALGFHWTSTTAAGAPNYPWNVSFSDGDIDEGIKTNREPVRAVRGGL